MELRKAKREDLEQIMELIDNAKCFLRSQGVDQWQNGYPDKDCLEKDIEKEIGYLCMLDGRPAGYVCIDFNGEPAYNTLSGSCLLPGTGPCRLCLPGRQKNGSLKRCAQF